MPQDFAIFTQDLRKSYGAQEAVRGIDLRVQPGEIFGLLGPNGAGKTTTVEILEGLRARSSGEVRVLGLDPGKQAKELKDRIGVCLQETNMPDKMRVSEALDLFGSLYTRRSHSENILKRVGLWDKRAAFYSTLSGGQKQRLALGLALINQPALLFLDEPTTGLDPQVRRDIHELILEARQQGLSVVLTTHYIEEAERLCDQVAIIDQGKIIELGTPQQIQSRVLGQSLVEATFDRNGPEPLSEPLRSWLVEKAGLKVAFQVNSVAECVMELVHWCDANGYRLRDLTVRKTSLEDAFIKLTGRHLEEE